MIALTRCSIANSRMITGPQLRITRGSNKGLGRILCVQGPLLERPGVSVEMFVTAYVRQLNKLPNLIEMMQEQAGDSNRLTFLSYWGNQEDGCPTHLLIWYLAYSAPNIFEDARGYSKPTDRYLSELLASNKG